MFYLIVALVLTFIALFAAVVFFSAVSVSSWVNKNRESIFALIIWLIIGGMIVSALTQYRLLSDENLSPLTQYQSSYGRTALIGFWAVRLSTWLVVLLAGLLLFSGFLGTVNSPTTKPQSGGRVGTKPLALSFAAFYVLALLMSAMFGAHPSFAINMLYPPLLVGAALLLGRDAPGLVIRQMRLSLYVLLVISLLAALIVPERVLETGYDKGVVAAFHYRLWGAAAHANALGSLALFYLLIEGIHPWRYTLVRYAGVLSALFCLVLSQSKTNWIAGLLIVAFWGIGKFGASPADQGSYNRKLISVALSAMTMATVILLLMVYSDYTAAVLEHVFSRAEVGSLSGRDRIWEIALSEWRNNPVFGYGPAIWGAEYRAHIGLWFASHAHNQYLQTLSQSGLAGMLGLIIFFSAYFYYSLRLYAQGSRVFLAVFLVLFIRALTEVPFQIWDVASQETFVHIIYIALIAQFCHGHGNNTSRPSTFPNGSRGA